MEHSAHKLHRLTSNTCSFPYGINPRRGEELYYSMSSSMSSVKSPAKGPAQEVLGESAPSLPPAVNAANCHRGVDPCSLRSWRGNHRHHLQPAGGHQGAAAAPRHQRRRRRNVWRRHACTLAGRWARTFVATRVSADVGPLLLLHGSAHRSIPYREERGGRPWPGCCRDEPRGESRGRGSDRCARLGCCEPRRPRADAHAGAGGSRDAVRLEPCSSPRGAVMRRLGRPMGWDERDGAARGASLGVSACHIRPDEAASSRPWCAGGDGVAPLGWCALRRARRGTTHVCTPPRAAPTRLVKQPSTAVQALWLRRSASPPTR